MSNLSAVESALIAINDTVFQELCDKFMVRTVPNLQTFGRPGTQSGKQKTTKGTPDSYYQLENGKYVFIEYSTNLTKGVKKLKDDIAKCLDIGKTGIPKDEILEIVLCINFGISVSENKELQDIVKPLHINLKIYQLSYLATELSLQHRDLCVEYLSLPFDSGQIVPLETFISEYNNASGAIATPIDNPFFHREKEMESFLSLLESQNFIVLSGPPGVGKTKLVVEGIARFQDKFPSYQVFSVANKHYDLLEDLSHYLTSDKNSILFVDDANRIDNLGQILEFYKSRTKGNLKIIITVRDYALPEIQNKCIGIVAPHKLCIEKLNNEQVIDILKSKPFEILNSNFHREINKISDGNPRLAIMCAKLSIETQDLFALSDVSEMFEAYFSRFLKEKESLDEKILIQTAGIISFFYALPYKDNDLMKGILSDMNISYNDFLGAIDSLEKLELVDIQFEYVKISEQNLATFLFYKAFIKDGLLSIKALFFNYFENHSDRMNESIVSANNSFGDVKVKEIILPVLREYLENIKEDEKKIIKIFQKFGFYLHAEVKEYITLITLALPTIIDPKFSTHTSQDTKEDFKDELLNIIGGFYRYPYEDYEDYVLLGIEYVRRRPEMFSSLIKLIHQTISFDEDDYRYGYIRQKTLFRTILKGVSENDNLSICLFLSIAPGFIKFSYEHTKYAGGNAFTYYYYTIDNTQEIKDLRVLIFNALKSLYSRFPYEVLGVFKKYEENHMYVNTTLLGEEQAEILDFIEHYLYETDFEHCLYVQEQIIEYERQGITNEKFNTLKQEFVCYAYDVYLRISTDRVRDKTILDFEDYRDYERLKEQDIREYFKFRTTEDIDTIYDTYLFIQRRFNRFDGQQLDYIIDQTLKENFDLGLYFLSRIIDGNSEINYIPLLSFKNYIQDKEKRSIIWDLIEKRDFLYKTDWKLSYFSCLDDTFMSLTKEDDILTAFSEIKTSLRLDLRKLDKYFTLFPNLLGKIGTILIEKIESLGIQVDILDFGNYIKNFGEDLNMLCKLYILQHKSYKHFDYSGKALIEILQSKPEFLLEYITYLYSDEKRNNSIHNERLGFIWRIAGIELYLERIIDFIIHQDKYYFGISEHFLNSFFTDIEEISLPRAQAFIRAYVESYFFDTNKMNLIVDVLRHTMSPLFEEILLRYLELTQDLEKFNAIHWIENGGTYSGDTMFGDIEAGRYTVILDVIKKSKARIEVIPIKTYLLKRIDESKRSAEGERRRRFIEKNRW